MDWKGNFSIIPVSLKLPWPDCWPLMTSDILWDQLNGKDITALKNNCHKQKKIFHSPCFHLLSISNKEGTSQHHHSFRPWIHIHSQQQQDNVLSSSTGENWKVKNFPHFPSHLPHLSLMLRFTAKISAPNIIVPILPSVTGRGHRECSAQTGNTLPTKHQGHKWVVGGKPLNWAVQLQSMLNYIRTKQQCNEDKYCCKPSGSSFSSDVKYPIVFV